jgi:hypothetical protein
MARKVMQAVLESQSLTHLTYITLMTTFAPMGTAREQLLILITTPLYLIVIGIELFVSKLHKQDTYTLKDTAQNIYFMILNGLIDLAFFHFFTTIASQTQSKTPGCTGLSL